MPTLVLPPRLNEDCKAVRDAAILEGWEVYGASSWQIPPGLALGEPVLYSEPLFADVASAGLGICLLDPPAEWLVSVPQEYARRHIGFTTLHEARTTPGGPWFLKPAEDKSFAARVYASASELPGECELPGDTAVLLSEPVCWLLEVRCFILDRQITTLSPYFRHGDLAVNEEGEWPFEGSEEEQGRDFAERMLRDTRLSFPPSAVLDIGIIEGRGWAVVEVNPAWGSGIYGCNPKHVLPVLRRSSLPCNRKFSSEERRFLRPRVQIER